MNFTAASILSLDEAKLDNYPYILRLEPDEKQLISIDAIRSIDSFILRAIPSNKTGITRLILIDDAEQMSADAQNALLKNLEEPPDNALFILTTADPNKLLATVKSRTTIIRISDPGKSNLVNYLIHQGASKDQAEKAALISGSSRFLSRAF